MSLLLEQKIKIKLSINRFLECWFLEKLTQ